MFHFALASMGGPRTDAGREFDERYAAQPGFARYFRIVTVVWGIAFLAEAALKVIVIQTSSTGFAPAFTRRLFGIVGLWPASVWRGGRSARGVVPEADQVAGGVAEGSDGE